MLKFEGDRYATGHYYDRKETPVYYGFRGSFGSSVLRIWWH